MKLESAGWDQQWSEVFQPHIATGLVPGRIFTRNRLGYGVYTEQGEINAEMSGTFAHKARASAFPAVGDWVALRLNEGDGPAIIHEVMPRRTKLARKTAGSATEEQLMAANIDVLFIVCGLDLDFNLRRLERYLVGAAESGTEIVIVLNKIDLCPDTDSLTREVRSIAPGVPVVAISALSRDSASALAPYLTSGKTAALLGSSGAGKSTIVNGLLGSELQTTQATREGDGRGMHTTTHRELFILPGGGLILDNPGIRELQLWPEQAKVEQAFPEIEALAEKCEFRDCAHLRDQGCAIQAALATGALDEERWQNYLKLRKELRYMTAQVDENVKRAEKKRVKKLCGDQKRFNKRFDE
ncbi:MAG TPA: ribosome small subunit-dependent GTPase A [Terriglobales bacterium]|nr:ribosome small subunit-dependent GTPase A [Terriglobales bacterium]